MTSLGSKESALFKAAINFYENKHYKQGLKACEQILKKHPEHGETLAMKGLFMLYLGRRDDAFETARRGLKQSLQSHISWHVLGLMYRFEKNYEEAIKCYKNALRFDKDNFQILRDLALLQFQCRQLDGAIETRRRVLFMRPAAPFNWISLVVILHMSQRPKQAIDVLNIYLDIFPGITDEEQEHLYYKLFLMSEAGLYTEARAFLRDSIKKQNTRRCLETCAQLSFQCKDYAECESTLLRLIDINPDNRQYMSDLVATYTAQNRDPSSLFDMVYEKSLLMAVEFLALLNDEAFANRLPTVLHALLKKGSPATFKLFKKYLQCPVKEKVIVAALDAFSSAEPSSAAALFAAKYHASAERFDQALDIVNVAMQNDTDISDLCLAKAQILRKLGKGSEALCTLTAEPSNLMQDKFGASKIAKCYLRDGQFERAQELLASFVHKPTMKDKIGDLHEMQATWYLIEMGDRLYAEGKYLYAACFYRKIETVFNEFIDDQLDFHGYSLRRMSFVEYVKFLRFLDDELLTAKVFGRALVGLASCILALSPDDSGSEKLSKAFKELSVKDFAEQGFLDDIGTHMEHVRGLVSTAKTGEEACTRISAMLLKHHSEDMDAVRVCLKIALKRDALLLAQKLALRLKRAGQPVDIATERLDAHRESESMWEAVPLFSAS